MGFNKAVKSQSKLRAAIFGPSGAGKTYTALAIATGMGGKIALIDSERSSASKYADRFEFDQADLITKSVDEYINYINEAAAARYNVLIIDSLSHAWETLNDEVQKIADTYFKGNFWSAWSKGTPKQRKLVDSLLGFPGHLIATMRSKTEWQTASDGGKSRPVRVGLAPEQGKGIEYEFDILFEITPDHLANIIKDRTGKFQDKIIDKPGKRFGKELIAWLNEGAVELPFNTADRREYAAHEGGGDLPPKPSAAPQKPAPANGAAPPPQNGADKRDEFNRLRIAATQMLRALDANGGNVFSNRKYNETMSAMGRLKPDAAGLAELRRIHGELKSVLETAAGPAREEYAGAFAEEGIIF